MRMKTNLIIRNNKIRGSNTRKESFLENQDDIDTCNYSIDVIHKLNNDL